MSEEYELDNLAGHFARMEMVREQNPLGWVHPNVRPSNRRAATVHQMKITLKNVKPPVWRRVTIPSTYRLDEVADVLLAAMGWTNSHLHAFFIGELRYDMVGDWGMGDELDECGFHLREVFDGVGRKMRFEYDFGDGCEHDVVLEAVRIQTKSESEPTCLAGRRACPPEDCGGPWGYEEFVEIMENGPRSEEDRERLAWLPSGFDPAYFDIDETTEAMRSPMNMWHV